MWIIDIWKNAHGKWKGAKYAGFILKSIDGKLWEYALEKLTENVYKLDLLKRSFPFGVGYREN